MAPRGLGFVGRAPADDYRKRVEEDRRRNNDPDYEPLTDGEIADAFRNDPSYRRDMLDDAYQSGLGGNDGDEYGNDYVFGPDESEYQEMKEAFDRGVRDRKARQQRKKEKEGMFGTPRGGIGGSF